MRLISWLQGLWLKWSGIGDLNQLLRNRAIEDERRNYELHREVGEHFAGMRAMLIDHHASTTARLAVLQPRLDSIGETTLAMSDDLHKQASDTRVTAALARFELLLQPVSQNVRRPRPTVVDFYSEQAQLMAELEEKQ